MNVFQKANIGKLQLDNRIIRSATYEGLCDRNGFPTDDYFKFYKELSRNNIGLIITGFAFVTKQGKAIQPGQAGIDEEKKIPYFKKITQEVHKSKSKIFVQISESGRQTMKKFSENNVVGASAKKSFYFREKPNVLTKKEIIDLAKKFVNSALYGKMAGFDGVQIHAAHGYLLHQFILSSVNNRKDDFGIDNKIKIGTKFLDLVINDIRKKCGKNFPVIIKISGGDDYFNNFTKKQFINLIKFLDSKKVDAIEISYGTMDYALNIIRGSVPVNFILKVNPVFGGKNKILKIIIKYLLIHLIKLKTKKFSNNYNLKYSQLAKKYTSIPIITVGGIRDGDDIKKIIEADKIDFVSLSRPFICEPDFVKKLIKNNSYKSKCLNCNICTVMCDSKNPTRCYQKNNTKGAVK